MWRCFRDTRVRCNECHVTSSEDTALRLARSEEVEVGDVTEYDKGRVLFAHPRTSSVASIKVDRFGLVSGDGLAEVDAHFVTQYGVDALQSDEPATRRPPQASGQVARPLGGERGGRKRLRAPLAAGCAAAGASRGASEAMPQRRRAASAMLPGTGSASSGPGVKHMHRSAAGAGRRVE